MKLSTVNFIACGLHATNFIVNIFTGNIPAAIGWGLALMYCFAWAITLMGAGE